MHNNIKLLFLGLICTSALAQKGADMEQFFPIDAGHSYVEFSVKYMGYAKVKGRFADFSGMLRYDPSDESKTSATLAIKTESIDTDLEFRDNDLKSENWFDAKKFPLIKFVSKSCTKTKSGLKITGTLTIKDKSNEITIDLNPSSGVLKDVRGDAQVIFTGEMSLDRNDYGVEGKNWSAVKEGITAVESNVNIEFSLLGKQLKAANFQNWVKNEQQPPGKLYKIVKQQGVAACVAEFEKMKSENTVRENALIIVSLMLSLEGNKTEAVKLRETNVKAFPNSSNVAFTLGEAYASTGEWTKAKDFFTKALELDPNNCEAIELLKLYQ